MEEHQDEMARLEALVTMVSDNSETE